MSLVQRREEGRKSKSYRGKDAALPARMSELLTDRVVTQHKSNSISINAMKGPISLATQQV